MTQNARCMRLLRDSAQDCCLAGLGPGVRRSALCRGCPPLLVWLSFGLRSAKHPAQRMNIPLKRQREHTVQHDHD